MEVFQSLLHTEQAGIQADLLEPAVDELTALCRVALVDARVSEQVGPSGGAGCPPPRSVRSRRAGPAWPCC